MHIFMHTTRAKRFADHHPLSSCFF